MGFVRGGLVTILSIVLLVDLILMNSFFTFTLSLDYENVKQEITKATEKILQEEMGITDKVNKDFVKMMSQCENNTDYVFSYEGYTFVVNCTTISEGEQLTINKIIENRVEKFYYQEYDCSFFECLKTPEYRFFFISEQAKDYFQNKLYFTFMIALILIAAIFILIEQKLNLPTLLGGLLIVSSLPFAKLNTLFLTNKYIQFLTIFLESSHDVFLIVLITGIALVFAGIILRLLNWNSIKKKFSRKDVEEIVKEEISKVKEKLKKGPTKK
jgi:hypothetical protein